MPKVSARTYSRYSQEAIALLGSLIRAARKERKMTAQEIADRAHQTYSPDRGQAGASSKIGAEESKACRR